MYTIKTGRKRKLFKWLLVLLIFLCIAEIALRMYGFCDAVLMREDSAYEYIAIPQARHRFGKHIFYNSYSQRSAEINNDSSFVICAFGDSFINGGVPTDQDSLATSKLSKYLSEKNKQPVRVLNISAGSWGPDNCYAYLQKYGSFKSKQFVLFVSSHDAFDNMNFQKVVGVNTQFPDKQYKLAIVELLDRYILPRIFSSVKKDETEINKRSNTSVFNTGFLNFYIYCKQNGIALMIYLHSDKEESVNHNYNDQGKLIIDFCKQKNITLIRELDFNFPLSVFRDGIHFNEVGQEQLFEKIKDTFIIN